MAVILTHIIIIRILENTRDKCLNLRAQLESLKSSLENKTFTRIELQSKLTREVSAKSNSYTIV